VAQLENEQTDRLKQSTAAFFSCFLLRNQQQRQQNLRQLDREKQRMGGSLILTVKLPALPCSTYIRLRASLLRNASQNFLFLKDEPE